MSTKFGKNNAYVEQHGQSKISIAGGGLKFTGPFTSIVGSESEVFKDPPQNLFSKTVAGESEAWTHT